MSIFALMPLILAIQPFTGLDARDWKESAIVPVGATFAYPRELYEVLTRKDPNAKIELPAVSGAPGNSGNVLQDFMKSGKLPSEFEHFVVETADLRILDSSLAASVGYLSASASGSTNKIVVVEQWRKFLPVTITLDKALPSSVRRYHSKGKNKDEGGRKYDMDTKRERTTLSIQIGFSLSIVTQLDSAGARLDLNGLIRGFTAGANFSRLAVTSHTEVMGLSGEGVTRSLPSASSFLQAMATAGAGLSNEADISRRRHEALMRKAAECFEGLRNQAWGTNILVRPVVVGLDMDALERFTGTAYDGYGAK